MALEGRRGLLGGGGSFWFVANLLDRSSHGLVDSVVLGWQITNTVLLGTLLALVSYTAIVEGRGAESEAQALQPERIESAA